MCVCVIDLSVSWIYSFRFLDARLAREDSVNDWGELTSPCGADLGGAARPSALIRNSQQPGHPRLRHLRLVFYPPSSPLFSSWAAFVRAGSSRPVTRCLPNFLFAASPSSVRTEAFHIASVAKLLAWQVRISSADIDADRVLAPVNVSPAPAPRREPARNQY